MYTRSSRRSVYADAPRAFGASGATSIWLFSPRPSLARTVRLDSLAIYLDATIGSQNPTPVGLTCHSTGLTALDCLGVLASSAAPTRQNTPNARDITVTGACEVAAGQLHISPEGQGQNRNVKYIQGQIKPAATDKSPRIASAITGNLGMSSLSGLQGTPCIYRLNSMGSSPVTGQSDHLPRIGQNPHSHQYSLSLMIGHEISELTFLVIV